jgi:hypothetical protein
MWASLLATGADSFSSHHVHFVSIISQLSPEQGVLLKSLIGTESAHNLELAMDNIRGYYQSHEVRTAIEELVSAMDEQTDDAFSDAVQSFLNSTGIEPVHASKRLL